MMNKEELLLPGGISCSGKSYGPMHVGRGDNWRRGLRRNIDHFKFHGGTIKDIGQAEANSGLGVDPIPRSWLNG